jgi:hypothetical protein
MNCPAGEIGVRLSNRQRTIQHIECLHSMANVYNLRFRNNTQDYALYGSDVMIVKSEIGGQSNNRPVCQECLSAAWDLSENSKVTCNE